MNLRMALLFCTALFLFQFASAAVPASLVERLGFAEGTKVLLINADDCGLLHSENQATLQALKAGLVGSATIMTPCPWFPEMATLALAHPELDFGIHLTFTAEWEGYRWGPVLGRSAVPSLVDAQGYFWPSVRTFHLKARPEEAETEGIAQIQRALDAGIDVSHLDVHMHALGLDPRFFEVFVRLARRFDLPVRFIPSSEELREAQAEHLHKQGILFQDRVILGADVAKGEPLADYWKRKLRTLRPGVTELYIHVSADAPELRAMTGDAPFRTGWRDRVEEFRIFTAMPELKQILEEANVKLLRWKDLRNLQRQERGSATSK